MAAAAVHEDPMATAQDVQQQLATIKAPGTFATRTSSPADDLRLEVTGVGRIGWPITRETARKLCAVARPARYGLKCWRSLKNAQISTEVDRPLSLSVTRRLSMSWCVPCWNRIVFGEPTEELPAGVFIEEHVEELVRAIDHVDDQLFHFLIIEA